MSGPASQRLRRLLRRAAPLLAVLLGLPLGYVLVANTVLYSGLIQRAAGSGGSVELAWSRAFSPWPGRVYVTGLTLRLNDSQLQFRLAIDHAQVDVVLRALLHKQFRASRVVAEGVGFRLRPKVDGTAGRERLVAAFPPLEGLASPALRGQRPLFEPAPSAEELNGRWSVQLDAVDASINELWFLQYRYQGPGHVEGGFLLAPGLRLWVGPAVLALPGGALQVGARRFAPWFDLRASVTLTPCDLTHNHGLQFLRTVTGLLQLDAALADLGAVDLYSDGLEVRGSGTLAARLDLATGRLLPGSVVSFLTPLVDVRHGGFEFTGDLRARLWVEPGAPDLSARVALGGDLTVPWLAPARVKAALGGATAELSLHGADLSAGVTLLRLSAALAEARVRDARAVASAVSQKVPLLAPLVLGDGPLVLSGSAELTPEGTILRLLQAKLGGARLHGAARSGADGWRGAAGGQLAVPFGLRLRGGAISVVPLAPAGWLERELRAAGLAAEQRSPGAGVGVTAASNAQRGAQ